jgi:molybdate transport system substrate-binding protein
MILLMSKILRKNSWLDGLRFSPRISLSLLLFLSVSLSSFAAEVTVAAASDLATVAKPLSEAFEKKSGHKVKWINGSSGMIARQIEAGAPYDVFLSADAKIVADLRIRQIVEADTERVFSQGRLAIWSPKRAFRMDQLAGADVKFIALANPAVAPYGRAAREALEKAGLWQSLQPRIVLAESVLQAYQMASTGNADVALVAMSLVNGQPNAAAVAANLYTPLVQSAAVPAKAPQAEAGRQFVAFLGSAEAKAILRKGGFQVEGLPRR